VPTRDPVANESSFVDPAPNELLSVHGGARVAAAWSHECFELKPVKLTVRSVGMRAVR